MRWFWMGLACLLLAPASAFPQKVTNRPVYLGEEGPTQLKRQDVFETGPMRLRCDEEPVHAFNPDTGSPGARTHIVVARWKKKVCARRRGLFCQQRGAWAPVDTLRHEDLAAGTASLEIDRHGTYLLFGRSRHHPSRPNSWKLDILYKEEALEEPPGVFDSTRSPRWAKRSATRSS